MLIAKMFYNSSSNESWSNVVRYGVATKVISHAQNCNYNGSDKSKTKTKNTTKKSNCLLSGIIFMTRVSDT